jgi:Fur family iron response transcriptional regulator
MVVRRAVMRAHTIAWNEMSAPHFPGESISGATPREIDGMLRKAGLRPTRQRKALAELLFGCGDRHVSAEALYGEAIEAGQHLSLATVYNTLHQFCECGLIRAISVDTSRTYFDTNTGDHHHFFLEATGEVIDIPEGFLRVENLPEAPHGMEVSRVDVVVHVRPQRGR